MTISAKARSALYAQSSDDDVIPLIAIKPQDQPTRRYAADNADVEHDGNTYLAFPFMIRLPDADEEQPPQGRIELSNVSRELIETIRTPARSAPIVELRVVLASDHEDLVLGPLLFEIRDASYSAQSMQADLVSEPMLKRTVPHITYTPGRVPGVFRQ